jgi:putative ABC transport system substrate-binding protein
MNKIFLISFSRSGSDILKSKIQNLKWLVLATFLLATLSPAEAQQQKKIVRIGFLTVRAGVESREEAFRQGLRELGYIEGQNIVIEWRFAKGETDRIPELAAELVRLKVAVIVVGGSALRAMNSSKTVPMVSVTASDPVGSGLVASLARPGGNITGFSMDAPGLIGKRLELLKESFPKLSRVAALYDLTSPFWKGNIAEAEQAAQVLKIKLQRVGVERPDELDNGFSSMVKERAEGFIKFPSANLTSFRKRIVEFARKNRLPAIYEDRIIAEDGGLMSYGTDITDLYRRAATYVDKILKGTKPADLPVEEPKKFEFIINLKAAKQIGLTIPPNVLARADRVIR